METKWTFFISSTLEDLRPERQAVANQVLKMEEIPIGMEQFGAVDKSSWDNIEKFIDTADYYILIIAGKYGSTDGSPEGKSFTEREYWYAKSKGIPIIAFLHSDPQSLPAKFYEQDHEKQEKLEAFRKEVKSVRNVAFYQNVAELIGEVSASIRRAIRDFPRPGWVRSDKKSNDTQTYVHELEAELARTKTELASLSANIETPPQNNGQQFTGVTYVHIRSRLLADGVLKASYAVRGQRREVVINLKWRDIFMNVANYMFEANFPVADFRETLQGTLHHYVKEDAGSEQPDPGTMYLDDSSVENVQLVLESFNLVSRYSTMWGLTKLGRKMYVDRRADSIAPRLSEQRDAKPGEGGTWS